MRTPKLGSIQSSDAKLGIVHPLLVTRLRPASASSSARSAQSVAPIRCRPKASPRRDDGGRHRRRLAGATRNPCLRGCSNRWRPTRQGRRWRDGPMLREPGGARRRAPIVFRDRGAGHGASRTGATQMAASAPGHALPPARTRCPPTRSPADGATFKLRYYPLRRRRAQSSCAIIRVTARVTGRSKADGGRASCWSIVSSPDRRAPLGDRRSAPSTARREHARRRGSACEYRDRCRPGCSATTLRRGAPPAGLHRG